MIIRVVINSGQARAIRTFDADKYDFMTEKSCLCVYQNDANRSVCLLVPLQYVLMVELTEAEVEE